MPVWVAFMKVEGYGLRVQEQYYLPSRAIVSTIYNAHAKHSKKPESIWPLPIDRQQRKRLDKWFTEHQEDAQKLAESLIKMQNG